MLQITRKKKNPFALLARSSILFVIPFLSLIKIEIR